MCYICQINHRFYLKSVIFVSIVLLRKPTEQQQLYSQWQESKDSNSQQIPTGLRRRYQFPHRPPSTVPAFPLAIAGGRDCSRLPGFPILLILIPFYPFLSSPFLVVSRYGDKKEVRPLKFDIFGKMLFNFRVTLSKLHKKAILLLVKFLLNISRKRCTWISI